MMKKLLIIASILAAINGPAQAQEGGLIFQDKPQPLPDIEFKDGDGATHKLHEFRGKTILLNIWATWCWPCRKEMPTLDRLQATLGSERFQVVTLSIDTEGLDKVKKFFADLNVQNLPIYIDPTTRATGDLGVSGLPTTLLIDPSGRELARLIGPAEWDSAEMHALLKKHIGAN